MDMNLTNVYNLIKELRGAQFSVVKASLCLCLLATLFQLFLYYYFCSYHTHTKNTRRKFYFDRTLAK